MRRTITVVTTAAVLLASLASPLAAQTEPSTRPSPSTSPSGGAIAAGTEEGTNGVPLAFLDPAWQRVPASPGPRAREDHTWTVDAEGRYAWLFGGRDGGTAFDDLWRYDLAADAWERVRPDGRGPIARFGHSAAWVPDQGLVVFGGQRGSDFFGDLWTYDPERDAWTELPDRGGAPRPRYGSCAILGPDGRLWISHGFTFAGRFDDTRAYNFTRRRWASIAPDGRRPGQRCLHDCFRSMAGDMVLYGGQDDSRPALGDLWVMGSDKRWSREPDPGSGARRLYAVTEAGGEAWIFGGLDAQSDRLDDLWRVDRETLAFERVRPAGAAPAARHAGTLITDAARGRLLLFGGQGREALDDVWALVDRGTTTEDQDGDDDAGASVSPRPAVSPAGDPSVSPAPSAAA